jgi:hypothetical protein
MNHQCSSACDLLKVGHVMQSTRQAYLQQPQASSRQSEAQNICCQSKVAGVCLRVTPGNKPMGNRPVCRTHLICQAGNLSSYLRIK